MNLELSYDLGDAFVGVWRVEEGRGEGLSRAGKRSKMVFWIWGSFPLVPPVEAAPVSPVSIECVQVVLDPKFPKM